MHHFYSSPSPKLRRGSLIHLHCSLPPHWSHSLITTFTLRSAFATATAPALLSHLSPAFLWRRFRAAAAPWALLWPLSSLTPFGISLQCSPVCPLLSWFFILFISSWSFPFAPFCLSTLILWVDWITWDLGHFTPTLIQPKLYNIPVHEY